MISKIKSLKLKNFCGYRDSEFDFTDQNGQPKHFIVLKGANGVGKTSILQCIKILCNASRFATRDCSVLFNKYVFSQDYQPTTQVYKQKLKQIAASNGDQQMYKNIGTGFSHTTEMYAEATFKTQLGDKRVIINNKGVVLNQLPGLPDGHVYGIDADHPMEMNKFSLADGNDWTQVFIEMAKSVYNYDCEFGAKVKVGEQIFFTDFIIHKWGTKVHHKSMSAGQKKICSLLKSLCDIQRINNVDMILVDNIQMHIYYERHPKLFENLKLLYGQHQFILTTHSGTLIQYIQKKYAGQYIYDLWECKEKQFKAFDVKNTIKG